MVLRSIGEPLRAAEVPYPEPGPEGVAIRVRACAVCRTHLQVVHGELPPPNLPLTPAHEIGGRGEEVGARVERFAPGDRVGAPGLAHTAGPCRYCLTGRENLCDDARFTG